MRTVLLIDCCNAHLEANHTSGIFQMPELTFFSVYEYIPKNTGLPLMQGHALCMFKEHEAAVTRSTVRGSFKLAECIMPWEFMKFGPSINFPDHT
jgi:hypothetical protein